MVLERGSSHCAAAAAGELKSELACDWGLVTLRSLVTHSSNWRFPARAVGRSRVRQPGSLSLEPRDFSWKLESTRMDSDASAVPWRPRVWAVRFLFCFSFSWCFINPLPCCCATSAFVLSMVYNMIMDITIFLFLAILIIDYFSLVKS